MPKNAMVIGNFLSACGGSRAVCEDLVPRLAERGWQVNWASCKPGRLRRLADMLATVWRHRHDLSVAQIDVYSGSAFRWAEAVACLLSSMGKPFVLTLHGGHLPTFAHRRSRRVKRLLNSSSAVTAPSRYLTERMRSYRQDIILIPNPIDITKYSVRQRSPLSPRLVWLRAFHETYNPRMAIRALAALASKHPDATLLMIGPDKRDGSLERAQRLAQELNVIDRCSFVGAVAKSDVGLWLHRGDVFLNTSDVDNTPISVLEALACGLSVVSTNVGGIPDLLNDRQDAYLVPKNDSHAMASAVDLLLNSPSLAAELSNNGRKKAMAFDWSVVLPKWESLLSDVASRRVVSIA